MIEAWLSMPKATTRERSNLTDAHFGLGVAFVRAEFYRRVILALGRALELRSPFAEAHYNLGVAYHRLERYCEAVHHYGIARRQDPGLEGVTFSRGRAFEQSAHQDSASVYYHDALEEKPFEAKVALARLARAGRGSSMSRGEVSERIRSGRATRAGAGPLSAGDRS
tara:strand:+ start:678 stop:1178 length:501 start_codon:yes stop_codon:yes gene_type:complete